MNASCSWTPALICSAEIWMEQTVPWRYIHCTKATFCHKSLRMSRETGATCAKPMPHVSKALPSPSREAVFMSIKPQSRRKATVLNLPRAESAAKWDLWTLLIAKSNWKWRETPVLSSCGRIRPNLGRYKYSKLNKINWHNLKRNRSATSKKKFHLLPCSRTHPFQAGLTTKCQTTRTKISTARWRIRRL